MGRDEITPYEQDRLGNERKKLDQLRAQEGMLGADDDDNGIQDIGADDVDTQLVVYDLPTHADQVILDLIHAYNSTDAAGTFTIYELEVDDEDTITGDTRRSVPFNVAAGVTRALGYEGEPFENPIGIEASFEGTIGVAVLADHRETSEPALDQS